MQLEASLSGPLVLLVQVLTPVYASAMRVAVNLDSTRSSDSAPQPSYPDICFAVDSFGEDLHSMARPPPTCLTRFQSYPVAVKIAQCCPFLHTPWLSARVDKSFDSEPRPALADARVVNDRSSQGPHRAAHPVHLGAGHE